MVVEMLIQLATKHSIEKLEWRKGVTAEKLYVTLRLVQVKPFLDDIQLLGFKPSKFAYDNGIVALELVRENKDE